METNRIEFTYNNKVRLGDVVRVNACWFRLLSDSDDYPKTYRFDRIQGHIKIVGVQK